MQFRIDQVKNFHNETQTLIQETKYALKDIVAKGVDDIENKLAESSNDTKDTIGALRYCYACNKLLSAVSNLFILNLIKYSLRL